MVEPGKKVAGGSGLPGSQVIKRRAELHAAAYASTIQELRSAGFVSRRALADELNRKGIPTARGGKWHYTTVVRTLARLGLLTWGTGARVNNGEAKKLAADARAEALEPTIRKLRRAGLSARAIALELNMQEVPTARGGKWHTASVTRILHRLEKLEPTTRDAPEGETNPPK